MPENINIPGYRIERKLGQGGMAAVYLAIQESFEREVALKIMSPLLNSDPSFTTRFIREARIVAHIHHASIVPVFDVGEHQPYHYLSMEYLPGGDLKQRILKGPCNSEQVAAVCAALCGALDVAHRKGFVHRDIKPENILFREDGTPVLTDFGIARAVDRGASLTVAGMLVGTPSYMSPEQVKGIELDGRSDLYSLGIVCYEMLTGTVPFRADSTMSVALKHLSDAMPPLPPGLEMYQTFIDRLTAKDVKDRFANGSEAVQALRLVEFSSARSEATMLRPMPPEITAQLRAKPPRRRYVSSAVAATRAAAARVKTSLARRWAARPHLPKITAPQFSIPSFKLEAATARWIGVAGVLVIVAAVATTVIVRNAGAPATKKPVLANQPAPAVVVAPVPIETPTTVTASPQPGSELPVPTADAMTAAVTPETDAVTTDPAAAVPDPAAEAAARARVAEQRNRKRAQARLEEIRKEREAQEARDLDNRVQRLLAAAKTARDAGALIRPEGESAADRYREVLQLRPGHPEAAAGIERIVDLLVDEARRAHSVGDAKNLRELVAQIARLRPDHRGLPDLENALVSLEATPVERSRREAEKLTRVSAFITRSYFYLDRKPLDLAAVSAATNQYDKAIAIVEMAPGLPSLKERIIGAYAVAVRSELSGKDPKRALRVIALARKRGWMSPDLEELALSVKEDPKTSAVSTQ